MDRLLLSLLVDPLHVAYMLVVLAQFTPPTQGDIYPATNPSCEGVACENPACSIRAQIVYMRRLLKTYSKASSNRERWKFAWTAYNQGPGNMRKERRKCRAIAGCDPNVWTGNVENICLRAAWACKESGSYAKKILRAMGRL